MTSSLRLVKTVEYVGGQLGRGRLYSPCCSLMTGVKPRTILSWLLFQILLKQCRSPLRGWALAFGLGVMISFTNSIWDKGRNNIGSFSVY
jgi:hypothetical protein